MLLINPLCTVTRPRTHSKPARIIRAAAVSETRFTWSIDEIPGAGEAGIDLTELAVAAQHLNKRREIDRRRRHAAEVGGIGPDLAL